MGERTQHSDTSCRPDGKGSSPPSRASEGCFIQFPTTRCAQCGLDKLNGLFAPCRLKERGAGRVCIKCTTGVARRRRAEVRSPPSQEKWRGDFCLSTVWIAGKPKGPRG